MLPPARVLGGQSRRNAGSVKAETHVSYCNYRRNRFPPSAGMTLRKERQAVVQRYWLSVRQLLLLVLSPGLGGIQADTGTFVCGDFRGRTSRLGRFLPSLEHKHIP